VITKLKSLYQKPILKLKQNFSDWLFVCLAENINGAQISNNFNYEFDESFPSFFYYCMVIVAIVGLLSI
jgi:hypothetical protein